MQCRGQFEVPVKSWEVSEGQLKGHPGFATYHCQPAQLQTNTLVRTRIQSHFSKPAPGVEGKLLGQRARSEDRGCEKVSIGLMRWYIQHRMHIYPSLDALRHLEVTAVLVVRQVRQRNLAPEIRSEEGIGLSDLCKN